MLLRSRNTMTLYISCFAFCIYIWVCTCTFARTVRIKPITEVTEFLVIAAVTFRITVNNLV